MSEASKLWIAAVVVAASAVAHADGTNEIRAVTFDDTAGVTRVHVRGADVPTFTAYKLDRPSRVVIDLPHARLADVLRGHESAATFTPSTWAVSTIAAQQLDDGTVRVIVTLARPGRYDVTTTGDDVDIAVTARDPAPKTVSPDDLARVQAARDTAQQQAAQSQAQAKAAQQQADAAKAEAERLRAEAADQAAKAATATNDAKRASAAEAAKAKAIADKAQADAAAAEQRAEAATRAAQADADHAKADASQAKADADQAKADAAAQISKSHDEVARAQAATDKAKADAAAALAAERAEADKAKRDAAAARQEAAAARADAERAEHDTQAKLDAAHGEASAAKDEVARAKADAEKARAEARAEKTAADQARTAAAADKRAAEHLLADANGKLAALDKKTADAQALEDRARAANAAAAAREEAAQDAALLAKHDRDTALAAAKQAEDAQKKAAASDRERLAADAAAAEQHLADAKRATDDAEARRTAAETAATAAQQQLAQSRTALADVEAQRTAAVAAAGDAARKRSDAEAAATDAAHRRADAEAAAHDAEAAAVAAAKKKSQAERDRDDAEAQRAAALAAARSAQLARDAADKQRQVAETAAHAALSAKQTAEQGLSELTDRRLAAEAAARDLEARAKAEATAQAEIAAAEARKANARDLDAARAELAKLAADRKHAEAELADRRTAVAAQQAESARLDAAATEAHAAAEREETRRAELAKQRSAEEQQLEQLDSRVADAEAAAKTADKAAADKVAQAAQDKAAQDKAAQDKAAQDKAAQVAAKPVVVADAPKPKLDKVAKVDFHGSQGAGQIDIAVGTGAAVTTTDVTGSRVELVVDHAELAPKLERTLDVSKFGSPVKSISSFRDRTTPDRVRVVVELAQVATPTVARDASGVHWRFATAQVRATNVPPPVVGGFGAVSTPIAQQSVTQLPPQGNRRHIYHGAPVDVDIDNAPLHEALRIIQDIGHINLVVPDTIDPRVTVKLTQVPWDEALEVILSSHQLWYRKDGNIYRIAPRKELDQEDEAEAARREAALKAEAPRPETVTLNYASADQLRTQLQNLLSSKGHITVDKRTNTLIIDDVSGNRAEVVKLALSLDTQTPEIAIEARIVEADSTFSRSFGIQWGGNGAASAAGGNATGLQFPSSVGVAGGADDQTTNATGIGASPSDFAVNLPATVGTNEGGALGISLGSIGGNFNINLRLSAAEDTGNVRIISSPKVTVLNNKHATISQGTSIPISVVSAAGTNTQFVQADLTLDVTPNVSYRDCAIAMDLHITNDQPDFSQTGPQGDPTIQTKTATTSMLVNDGETAVLGGIYTRNSAISYNKVPFLGDIPVLGWLFKKRTESDNRSEILVFITPRIVNRANLLCGATH